MLSPTKELVNARSKLSGRLLVSIPKWAFISENRSGHRIRPRSQAREDLRPSRLWTAIFALVVLVIFAGLLYLIFSSLY